MRLSFYLFATAFLLVGPSSTSAQSGPGIEPSAITALNCTTLGTIEAVICGDPELQARHRTIVTLFEAARVDAFNSGPSAQETRQRSWLKVRDESCSNGSQIRCLIDRYDARLKELAVAALFLVPETALAELRRQESKTAPLYEAIYKYATIDGQAERTNTVEMLIAPIFDEVHESFEGNVHPFADLQTVEAAAASDEAFALFLAGASVGGHRTILPCEALIRRPGLIKALGPLYGGARDGWLPYSNCDAMLPELPSLTCLAQQASGAQPFCQGTIRFSVWSYYAKLLAAVRLHRPDIWHPLTSRTWPREDTEVKFRSEHQSWIADAATELTKYYVTAFKVSPDAAKADAESAADAVTSRAFFHCGG